MRNSIRCAAAITSTALCMASTAMAADIFKADNTDDLNLTTSWTNGVVPGQSDVAVWDHNVTSANATLLATNTTWDGVRIADPSGAVTISATSTNLSAGAALTLRGSGIDLSAATADLTLSNGVATTLGYISPMVVGSGRTLHIAGPLTRASQSIVTFDTTAGGTINIASGITNSVLTYSTLNGTDVGALDTSLNVVPAASVVNSGAGYEANPSGVFTTPYIDFVNGASDTTADSALGGSGSVYFQVIRFNTPQPNRNYWLVDTGTKNFYVDNASPNTILVTPNVGAQDITWTGAYNSIRWNHNAELILDQENTAGTFYMTGPCSDRNNAGGIMTKVGAGRVIWNSPSGMQNYGATRILEGEFDHIDGLTSHSAIRVYSGGKFAGNGTYVNNMADYTGGTLAAGDQYGAGRMVIDGGSFQLGSGSTLQFYGQGVPATNTEALMLYTNGTAAADVGGTVTVDIMSGTLNVGSYPLLETTTGFSQTNFVLGLIKPHVTAHLDNLTSNTLDLVVDSVNQPLVWTNSSGTWDLSTVNWQDQSGVGTTYQENGPLGDSVEFEDSLSGAGPITVTVNSTLTPSTVLVNNSSKDYTISGTGDIGGGGSFTKEGSGILALGMANTFTGGINLNGGTTVFSSLNQLGAGGISFGGGTLQYNGNTDDISSRTVTFNAGGGTVNIGANDVTFANPVGNNGAGGLTKTGSGTLTLNGTNDYNGDTVISQGTLALATGAALPNSANIVLGSGAVFDVNNTGGFFLGQTAAQTISGDGYVSGSYFVATNGSTISPGSDTTFGTLSFTNNSTLEIYGTVNLKVTTTNSDMVVADFVNLYPGMALTIPNPALTNGDYKLMQFNIGYGGSAANIAFVLGQPGKSGDLVIENDGGGTNSLHLLVSSAASDNITWSGTDYLWDLSGRTDWYLTSSTTPWAFTNGDTVRFDEVGATYGSLNIDGVVKPSLVVVSNSVTSYTFNENSTGSKISGGGGLIKLGAADLTINTVNDNTGPINIKEGTVTVTGSLGAGPVTNDSQLVLKQNAAQTIASISGTGSLVQNGANTTVTGDANYTGPTTITSGTLSVGSGGPEGVLATSAITNNGTLILNSSTDWNYNIPEIGTGNLIKQGTNTLTISVASTRSGVTEADGGRIILAGANQLAGSADVENGAVMDINGNDQTFTGLAGATYSGHLVNNAGTATNVVTINGGGDCRVIIDNNEGTGGVIAVVKNGTNELTARSASTFTGGLTINAGSWNMRTGNAQGLGPITMDGGTLAVYNGGNVGNAITVLSSGTISHGGANIYFNAPVTGNSSAVLNVSSSGNVFTPQGGCNLTNFYGTIVLPGPGFENYRCDGYVGGANTTFDLGTNALYYQRSGGRTSEIGLLLGQDGSRLNGNNTTYIIGGKNLSGTFSGTVDGTATTIVKEGTGTQTFASTNNWEGGTTVNGGTLTLTGVEGNPTNTTSVMANAPGILDVSGLTDSTLYLGNTNGVTIGGDGTITGSVVVDAVAVPTTTVAPGNPVGVLNVSGNLTVPATTTFAMELNNTNTPTADRVTVGGTFTVPAGATVTVTNVGPMLTAGQVFTLFDAGVPGVTTVIATNDAYATYVFNDQIATTGQIEVMSVTPTINPNPPQLQVSYNSGTGVMSLGWPTNGGWILQSNSVSLTDTNAWFEYPPSGSTSLTNVDITVDPNNPNVFFRMVMP